jgi:hypothetical protein
LLVAIESPKKIADTVARCADMLNLGTSTFRREYIQTGLVKPVDLGGRGLSIILAELHSAVARRAAEQRADPSKKKLRNAGAVRAARGDVSNPWGRKGKPKKLARG